MRKVLALCSLLASSLIADTTMAQEALPPVAADESYSWPFIEISGLGGSDGTALGGRALLPVYVGSRELLFVGVDGLAFGTNLSELFQGDFGEVWDLGAYLGYRQYVSRSWIAGAWIGADAQRTLVDNTFGRAIGGLELYNQNWVVRFSGFTPFDRQADVSLADTWSPNASAINAVMLNGAVLEEQSPTGLDLELGARQQLDLLQNGGNLDEIRLSVGGFHYFNILGTEDLTGGRLRGAVDLYPFEAFNNNLRLTLEGQVERDRLRDNRYAGGIRLAIPLGEPGSDIAAAITGNGIGASTMPANLFRPVHRQQDIVTSVEGGGNQFVVTDTKVKTIKIAPQNAGTATLTLSATTSPVVLTGPAPFNVQVNATFANTGNRQATNLVGNITASNGDTGFAGNCGTSLASGATCQVTFTTTFFAPGPQTITIDVTYFDGASQQTITQTFNVTVTVL